MLGNSAASRKATTQNYLTDGADSQSEALHQPLVVTDQLGHATRYRYDARGNKVTAWDALGNRSDAEYNLADKSPPVVRVWLRWGGLPHRRTRSAKLCPS